MPTAARRAKQRQAKAKAAAAAAAAIELEGTVAVTNAGAKRRNMAMQTALTEDVIEELLRCYWRRLDARGIDQATCSRQFIIHSLSSPSSTRCQASIRANLAEADTSEDETEEAEEKTEEAENYDFGYEEGDYFDYDSCMHGIHSEQEEVDEMCNTLHQHCEAGSEVVCAEGQQGASASTTIVCCGLDALD